MTIVEFLTARLDEDAEEAASSKYDEDVWWMHGPFAPERVRGEIVTRRAMLADHETVYVWPDDQPSCRRCNPDTAYPCPTLRFLVQPYAGHPDFDPAWKVA